VTAPHGAIPEELLVQQVETRTRELIRPMPLTWWMRKKNYALFMLRDFTSIPIAAYGVFLMVLMYQAGQSPGTFRAFYDSLLSTPSWVLHLIALVFAVYHSVSFFNLTPQVIRAFRGDEQLPGGLIAGLHYIAWIVVSAILILTAWVWFPES
jgi:fumarate reductase subunit C